MNKIKYPALVCAFVLLLAPAAEANNSNYKWGQDNTVIHRNKKPVKVRPQHRQPGPPAAHRVVTVPPKKQDNSFSHLNQ